MTKNAPPWKLVLDELSESRFAEVPRPNSFVYERWYVRQADPTNPSTYLTFKLLHGYGTLEVQIGWRIDTCREFIVRALMKGWPRGYERLEECGALDAPCLDTFNLRTILPWESRGVTLKRGEGIARAEIRGLLSELEGRQWTSLTAKSLLDIYVSDEEPVTWLTLAAPVRIGEIGALVWMTGANIALFDTCASQHKWLIDAQMADRDASDDWIRTLRDMAMSR